MNWPKLNTPQWAIEAYQDTMERASRDPIMGPLLSQSKAESGRLGNLEEGKKRRE